MTTLPPLNSCTLAVIGLGYVGLPLAVEFGKPGFCARTDAPLKRTVIGFDINSHRLAELQANIDRTNEISSTDLESATFLRFTANTQDLLSADVFIITVPTPIDSAKQPDLTPLRLASKTVGDVLRLRKEISDILPVILFESTVYPGATEEVCIPIIEQASGLSLNEGFICGYSPERINPGDKNHRLASIVKVTSGSTPEAAQWIDSLYGSIITAGTHLAPSIKVAEASKVIENTQRDLNIALVNELSIIFRHLMIDTHDVLEAAGSKWNFLSFKPGLVGGHCIGVDPYYLTYKAEQVGYHPQIILAGRRINDGMARWVTEKLVLELAKRHLNIPNANVLILGFSFKENCPDIRNTKVYDLYQALLDYGMTVTICDPCVDQQDAINQYSLEIVDEIATGNTYDVVILAVAHTAFLGYTESDWQNLLKSRENGLFIDLKASVPRALSPFRL